jgi:hypothetical protein
MKTTQITIEGMRTEVWNGTPIVYEEIELPKFDGAIFVLCADYKRAGDDFPRYVAIRDGEVVAVEIASGFCNMVVDPIFSNGSMMLLPPAYESRPTGQVYRVPVVRLSGVSK